MNAENNCQLPAPAVKLFNKIKIINYKKLQRNKPNRIAEGTIIALGALPPHHFM
jgi:hypothetical protein